MDIFWPEQQHLPALGVLTNARLYEQTHITKRSKVIPRAPIAYASLLVLALVAVIGFAAFSPSDGADATAAATETDSVDGPVTARVAAAILAIRTSRVSEETETPQTDEPDSVGTATVAEPGDDAEVVDADPESVSVHETSTTTATADTTPPSFTITSPHDGDTVDTSILEFKGTVERGATVRSGPFDAQVADDGTWSISLALVAGDNGASFSATDSAGNTTTKRIVISYAAPQTRTTTAPATTTTKAQSSTATTTTKPSSSSSTSSQWSPNWPADAGGIRNVEQWRSTVARYWAADRVDCVLGIILRESRGDPRAYNSRYRASGLMQHLIKYWPGRAASAGFKDSNGLVASPYSGEANIAAGAAIAGSGSNWYAPWSRLPSYGTCSG